jgi:hypothetical protein
VADTLVFRLTNRVANPVLLRLLRSRAGRRSGRRLAVLRYTGTVTGRRHELVVLYARTGPTVWIAVSGAQHKSWWRNLGAPADVVLWLAGEERTGRAVAVDGAVQPEEARTGLAAYLAGMPAAARGLGVRDRNDPAQVGAAAARSVLVRVDLEPRTGG